MSELTKDEFRALLEIQAKNVEQLTTIANHLTTIVDTQNSIHDRLYNGMGKEIAQMVIKHQEDMQIFEKEKEKELKAGFETTLNHSTICTDIKHTKWFIGIVGIVIIVALVVIRGIDSRGVNDAQSYKAFKKVEALLMEHVDTK